MRYLITIEYDGSKYYGLQKLKDKKTVQGELENVLTRMNESFVKVTSAGRTDRGVHALNQKCHFELIKDTNPYKLRYYLNRSTSSGLYVKSCEELTDMDFHARFSVKSKTYIYKINVGEYSAIMDNYIYNYNKELNLDKMKEATVLFCGPHNFRAFVTGKHKTYDSIIDKVDLTVSNNIISIEIKGKAFYTYMVRNIVSALILIGSNKITKNDLEKMLKTGNKTLEFGPVPPNGLYLKEVKY